MKTVLDLARWLLESPEDRGSRSLEARETLRQFGVQLERRLPAEEWQAIRNGPEKHVERLAGILDELGRRDPEVRALSESLGVSLSEVSTLEAPPQGQSMINIGDGNVMIQSVGHVSVGDLAAGGRSDQRPPVGTRSTAAHSERPRECSGFESSEIDPPLSDSDIREMGSDRQRPASAGGGSGQSPDLELQIRCVPGSGAPSFTLELHAADPSYQIHRRSFGPVQLKRDPAAYLAHLFEDVRNSSSRLSSPRRALRELEAIGSALFQQIMPQELGQLLMSLQGRLETLLIESDEPWIPWELLRLEKMEGGRLTSARFLCEAFATSRWLRGCALHDRLPLRRMALVAPRDDQRPGIAEELAYLEGLRKDEREVDRIPAHLESVLQSFDSGRYDGWHFSGHAIARDVPEQASLLLDGQGKLRLHHLHAEARHLGLGHPLVFLNACHTGRGGMSLTGIDGWAERFLAVGAGAFIGTYWAVGGDRAPRFCRAFYKAFLSGKPIAEAFRRARLAIRTAGDPSWLAYTLYAHPLARSVEGPMTAGSRRDTAP